MNNINNFDFSDLTPEDKATTLGDAFRFINVQSFGSVDGVLKTTIIFRGKEILLIGDPEKALKNHIALING
jgi:hypothetical protein